MTPQPIYCRRCGEWTGKDVMKDRPGRQYGEHADLEECVENLHNRIKDLEDAVNAMRNC